MENVQYEELMLELSLKKKEQSKVNGFGAKDPLLFDENLIETTRKGREYQLHLA